MSHVSTPWTLLASRVARGLLSRKGVTLRELTERFSALQIEETARGIDGKIARGTYSFAFFLQLLKAIRSECPNQWCPTLALDLSYEEQATYIFSRELSTQGLDLTGFLMRLSRIGIRVHDEEVKGQVPSGLCPAWSKAFKRDWPTICRRKSAPQQTSSRMFMASSLSRTSLARRYRRSAQSDVASTRSIPIC